MAQPNPKPNQPLLDVLRQSNLTIAEMNQMLEDGAQEIERLIPKLIEKHSTGDQLKAAQLALVRRELLVVQSALWGDLGSSLREGVGAAVVTAAINAEDILLRYLEASGQNTAVIRAGLIQQAKAGINAVLAKAKNGIPLSRALYQTQALATDQVNRKVSQGLLLGMNAKAIAKSVKELILPSVPGGVSYAAHRLARTEINHAYKTSQERRYEGEPWTQGMRWNLSKSHPTPDICNVLAQQDNHRLGPGIYPVGHRPDSHPNCMCYLTPEQLGEDEFIDRLLMGQYDDYLDSELGIDADSIRPAPRPLARSPKRRRER